MISFFIFITALISGICVYLNIVNCNYLQRTELYKVFLRPINMITTNSDIYIST